MPDMEKTSVNTDRELFREDTGEPAGSYYENSLHVTAQGEIGMNVGGTVVVLPIAEWHHRALASRLMTVPSPTPDAALTEEEREALSRAVYPPEEFVSVDPDEFADVTADVHAAVERILSDRLAAVEREQGEAQSAAYLKDQEAEGFREMARSAAAANLALLSTQSEIRQRAEIAEAERDDLRAVVERVRELATCNRGINGHDRCADCRANGGHGVSTKGISAALAGTGAQDEAGDDRG